MVDYVYKLNIPPIEQILLDSARELIFKPEQGPAHKSFKAGSVLKPEWRIFKNFVWKDLILFYKPDFLGTIHVDDTDRIRDISESCVWGINFIYGGSAVMEFWEVEDMNSITKVSDGVGTYNHRCETDNPARLTYHMGPGAYLVNASKIHRVRGIGNRYALVLRDNNFKIGPNWEQLRSRFKDVIDVGWPGV